MRACSSRRRDVDRHTVDRQVRTENSAPTSPLIHLRRPAALTIPTPTRAGARVAEESSCGFTGTLSEGSDFWLGVVVGRFGGFGRDLGGVVGGCLSGFGRDVGGCFSGLVWLGYVCWCFSRFCRDLGGTPTVAAAWPQVDLAKRRPRPSSGPIARRRQRRSLLSNEYGRACPPLECSAATRRAL